MNIIGAKPSGAKPSGAVRFIVIRNEAASALSRLYDDYYCSYVQ
jgi:hypothetical protein